jgi:hypothetical protein
MVSWGPHRVGIRAILTLGNPSLAWALDRTKDYFLKIKEMALYIKGKYLLLSSLPLFFKHLLLLAFKFKFLLMYEFCTLG